jgi:predicted transcriptional regulator
MKKLKLTPFELEIMTVLWRLGKGSVREMQELLPQTRQPAYTTVQTIVYRLEEKGALRRVRKIGNAHIFQPVISRREAHHRLISDLLDVFGGSAQPLMAHLVESGKLRLADLRELETALQKLEKTDQPPAGTISESSKSPIHQKRQGKRQARRKTS